MSDIKVSADQQKSSPRRRGSTGCDVSDNERELAQSSSVEFNKKNFSSCSNILNKLLATRPKDIKVLSNKAVIDYFKSDLKKTDLFQKNLIDICNQNGVKIDKISQTDEVDASVIRLNHCTVLFHLRNYRMAVSLLEDMYTGLESLEETVSIGLCLLLAECLLGLSYPGRALTVVAHTEATFLPQPLPPQTSGKMHTDISNRSPDKGTGSHDDADSPLCARTNIMNSHTSADSIGGSSELRCSADQELLRSRLHLLRIRCLLMMRVMRVAKKEVKAVVTHAVISGSELNVTLIMLKSQLEYLRGNLRKSVKVLNQCAAIPAPDPSFGPKLSVAYYNNLGIIHLGLGKPTLACFYLQKALRELKDGGEKKGDCDKLYSNSCRVESDLCHNLGVTLLHMNKPAEAFDFLIEVIKVYSTNPRLWMRLAECCIAVHKINIESDGHQDSFKTCTKTVGLGEHRKVCIVQNSNSHDKKLIDQQHTTDSALPVPTLEFARLCLRNSLALIPENVPTAHLTDEQEASGVLPELYPCHPSPPMKGPQLMNIKLSCLVSSAYVCLCLGDYLMSLQHSQALLAILPQVAQGDGMYKVYGHLYAGESLIYLDRVQEAINHFDPRLVGDVNLVQKQETLTDNNNSNEGSMCPTDSGSSQRLLRYNLCVAYAIMGQFDKARTIISEIVLEKSGETPAQIVMLALYISLQMGKRDLAKSLLQKHMPPS